MRTAAIRRSILLRTALIAGLCLAGGRSALGEDEGATAFPDAGLMPKREIGADRFLAEHPEADGRGIVVAIFDTGVDPGAPGLGTTTDGKPKIIDLVDGSGSGDVDTTTVRKAEKGTVEGLGGRPLKVAGLSCPTNEWHLGLKPGFELFPRGLVKRLEGRRRKAWDEIQRGAEVVLERRLEALAAAETKAARDERQDVEKRLEQLKAMQEAFEDPGPVFDCVVFHDGKVWRAVIDTDEDGDLGDERALSSYPIAQEWATFSDEARLNYGVNVYEDGRRLSIVIDAGAHGTHVAGIVAAHYPDRPELDGIAPGAQIVSVKIGDTRVGSNSMGTGEERGLIAALRNKCQLINMSFGGPTPTPNRTRMEALYSEIVNEHGVIFVSSAGNEGPALSTVAAPGGTCEALFGVGAYVSPEMAKAQYAVRKTGRPTQFTWSSRGPTTDGAMGVDFSAPGAAVAPVPNWLLQGSTQMNGTSMSSPNLCGGVALLLSALRARNQPWSPSRVRRALANSARAVDGIEPFALGHGLIQLPEAFDDLVRWKDQPAEDARYEVTLPGRGDARGLYLREPGETSRVAVERVQVKPLFREAESHDARIAYSMRFQLRATQDWIEVPEYLALQHGGERFEVRVDPRRLEAGSVNFGEVLALDASAPARGPVFRVPVTVIRPLPVADPAAPWTETIAFEPGTIARRFFAAPAGATWADLRIRTVEADASRLLVVHGQQLVPGRHFKEDNFEDWIRMEPAGTVARSFKVDGGRTLELVLAQYWSSLGTSTFEAELTFHGIRPRNEPVHFDGADLLTYVDLEVPFGRERLDPGAEVDTLRRRLRPTAFDLRAGDPERDMLPRGRLIHEAVLTYTLALAAPARVQPRSFQGIYEDLYESWSSALWMVFDENKRRVGTGPLGDEKPLALEKGTYTLRLHLRHEDPARLEAVRDAILYLDLKLDGPVKLPIYPSGQALLDGGPRFAARDVQAGDRVRLYVAPPGPDALPKLAEPADMLLGRIHYGAKDEKSFGSGRRPGDWPLSLHLPPAPSKEKDDAEDHDGEDGSGAGTDKLAAVREAVRDLEVERLAALREGEDGKAFDTLAAKILHDDPGHLPVLVEQLKRVDRKGPPYADATQAARVREAADRIVTRIDAVRLAAHFGRKDEPRSAEDKALDKRMRMRRDALVEALFRKARALAADGKGGGEAFQATYDELRKWTNVEEDRFLELRVAYERARGRLGSALEVVREKLAKQPARRALHDLQLRLLEELGWKHWVDHHRAWQAIRFPGAYPPF